jgi:hypothetical protein
MLCSALKCISVTENRLLECYFTAILCGNIVMLLSALTYKSFLKTDYKKLFCSHIVPVDNNAINLMQDYIASSATVDMAYSVLVEYAIAERDRRFA